MKLVMLLLVVLVAIVAIASAIVSFTDAYVERNLFNRVRPLQRQAATWLPSDTGTGGFIVSVETMTLGGYR